MVVEDAADPARFVPVRQEEVLVAPGLVFRMPGRIVGVAGALHGGVEGDGVGIVLGALGVEHGGQVAAAAEPALRRRDQPGVHVCGRNVRIARVDDHADPGGVKARVLIGAGDVSGELRRELAPDRRDVDTGLFEDPAAQHGGDAAATVPVALPGGALEATGGPGVEGGVGGVLDGLQSLAELVAEGLEPGAGDFLAFGQVEVEGHGPGFKHRRAGASPAGDCGGGRCGRLREKKTVRCCRIDRFAETSRVMPSILRPSPGAWKTQRQNPVSRSRARRLG